MPDDRFEVMSGAAARVKYGLGAGAQPAIALDPARVPSPLRHLIPLARRFGISDDLIRADVLEHTPNAELEAMRRAVAAEDDAFDSWLAGPEASGPTFSDEYIAFSCLRMAADES
jgi:hypothetical protein